MSKDLFGNEYNEADERQHKARRRAMASKQTPKSKAEEAPKEAREIPEWAKRQAGRLYFVHREYKECKAHPPLVFEYIGKLHYFDGTEVKDFVKVRCINDLGLRAYKAGAYTAVAKRLLSPYKEELPDPWFIPAHPPIRQVLAPSERVEKGLRVSALPPKNKES